MQFLLFCAISWIFFTISDTLTALGSLQNLEIDIFGDVPFDPTFIDNEPSSEQMSPLDQTTDPNLNLFDDSRDRYPATEQDMNMFIPEDVNLNEMTDSSLLLADDSFCDLDVIDETGWFRKVRRETFCRDTPVNQVKPQKRPQKNAPLSDLRFFYTDPMVMDVSEAMCPPHIFRTSTLPTCLTAFDGRSIPVPGQDWFNLEDVFPPEPLGCPGGFVFLWCCKEIVIREFPADPLAQLSLEHMLSPARTIFDGKICYQWKFAVLLEPPTKL